MLTKTWRDILEIAQRAPSPHNVQPWKVRITSEETCDVYIDIARTLPKEDTTGSFIISGMVMYLETMRYAAQTYQQNLLYELKLNEVANKSGLQLFATVTIQSSPSIIPEFKRGVILQRRTSRLPYAPKVIATADETVLVALAKSYGHTYSYTADKPIIEKALSQNIKALFSDFNSQSYHDEIVSWFRFTDQSSLQKRDGLDYRCMRIPATEYYLSARFPFILKLPILSSLFAKRYRMRLGATPCIAWLSGKFWEPEDAVIAGKLLIRYWLELTRMGLYLHPFGNLITNKEARSEFEALTDSTDVWFVIRIGYTEEPPESQRLPLGQILIKETTL
jgi:hypothetical protein